MLKIEYKNISMIRKDTGIITFSLDNYTLTDGDVLYFTVAESIGSDDYLFQKVVTEFESGVATINISEDDSDLEKGTYYYDIQINRSNGQIDTVAGPAKFIIKEGVTP